MRVTNRLERTAKAAFLVLGLGALSGLAGAQQQFNQWRDGGGGGSGERFGGGRFAGGGRLGGGSFFRR